MNWARINIQVNEDFRYMKIHIFLIFFFHISKIFIHLDVYLDPIH